jgi:hypothetical protein
MNKVNQYFKERTELFDDYYPCIKNEYDLLYIHYWIQFYVPMFNNTTINNNNFELN